MFHVVAFLTSKTVAVVPQSWYEDGCASWPTYNSDERINRAIKHGEEPQDDWQTHDVRIIKSSGMPNFKVSNPTPTNPLPPPLFKRICHRFMKLGYSRSPLE